MNDHDAQTLKLFGAHYYAPGTQAVIESDPTQLYHFKSFVGRHTLIVEPGDSLWWLSPKLDKAMLKSGPAEITSERWAVLMRGYMPAERTVEIAGDTVLPYVNGCSTKQLLPPIRIGDPTLQFLRIPPFSKEQAHHIHSTVRVVYVAAGRGVSIVGMEGRDVSTELIPGMVVYLEPMCPHHFETPQGEQLEVIPMHIYSSSGPLESNHPMFNGTHLMNQGA